MLQHQRGEPPYRDAAEDSGGQGQERVGRRDPEPADRQPGAAEAGREVRGDQRAEEHSHQVFSDHYLFIRILWIRIRSYPKLFVGAGSGSGSEI